MGKLRVFNFPNKTEREMQMFSGVLIKDIELSQSIDSGYQIKKMIAIQIEQDKNGYVTIAINRYDKSKPLKIDEWKETSFMEVFKQTFGASLFQGE